MNWQSSSRIFVLVVFLWESFACPAFAKTQTVPSRGADQSQAKTTTARNGEHKSMQKAIFGAGCFWGVEEAFRHIPGVASTAVGYSGGALKDPSYKDVCSGKTGHTEVVEVEYDPAKVPYEKLLETFFANHDPTTMNRQGPDVGYQYRSVIFYNNPEQEKAAQVAKEKADKSGLYRGPVVTAIEPAKEFYRAEEYHQRYLEKNGLRVCH